MTSVPQVRIQTCNHQAINHDGAFVLYWMIANRRTKWNFSLQHAIDHAKRLQRPLVILEALRCDYPWASDRLHSFVLDGMRDNASRCERSPVTYYPSVEPAKRQSRGLLEALAKHACLIVTDEFPCFFLPRMVAAAAKRVNVLMEKVDANGLLPLCAADRVFTTAHSFRRFLQKQLPPHLAVMPAADPLARLKLPELRALPPDIMKRWPAAILSDSRALLRSLPIDHAVAPVTATPGGERAATIRLRTFLDKGLPRYADARNQPQEDVGSGLSPYLHFGHLATHQVFAELMQREQWSPALLPPKATGSRSGWWGVSPAAEAFIDELITWREIGYNMCYHEPRYDQYESLPDWARVTLRQHARDRREYIYKLDEFEAGLTHDPLWNAAQTQLVSEGRIHNYLRMLWGKKILEWTASPEQALQIMIELNNRYALDGRNPNSYSGIFWVLGRYDRAWGPERPIFGKIRYMSSENTARKVKVREYIAHFSRE